MTASQPARDGEVCACGHRLAHHVSVGGCCIGACLCLAARPAAPSDPPAADSPTPGTETCKCIDGATCGHAVPSPVDTTEPPAETQQDEEPCCTVDGGGRCNDCPALAARPSADTETLRARIEKLESSYRANGEQRDALGKPAWPLNVARDLRAALGGPR